MESVYAIFLKNKKANYLTKNLINLRLACYHFLVQDFQQVLLGFFFGGEGVKMTIGKEENSVLKHFGNNYII